MTTTPPSPGVVQRRQGDPLEGGQVHAVPAHPGWAGQVDVGQDFLGSGYGLDQEALPAPTGA
jgi:hypothetical protein